eukprot:6491491-Amphidinium_carterae.1
MRHDYTAVMLNCNTQVPVHSDLSNTGASCLLSLAEHSKGELWVETEGVLDTEVYHGGVVLHGQAHDTFHRWTTFDGHRRHCVLEAVPLGESSGAERYSLTLFNPGRLTQVPSDVWRELKELGFPVRHLQCDCGEANVPDVSSSHSSRRSRGHRGHKRGSLGVTLARSGLGVPTVAQGLRHGAEADEQRREASSPNGRKSEARNWTTMTACMYSLETLWQEVQRRQMPSRFLAFFRKGLVAAACDEEMPSPGGDGECPLPCALPYDTHVRGAAPRSGRRRGRWHRVRHRRQWINVSIAYLDWLYLGKPWDSHIALSSVLCGRLTDDQWALVAHMEHTYRAACRLGEAPAEPSGGLAALSSDLLCSLEAEYGRKASKATSGQVLPQELTEHNMSLPEVAGIVPLRHPIIPSVFEEILTEPDVFLRSESDMPEVLPTWYMNVASWPGIARQLLKHGLCRPVHPSEAHEWRGQHLRAGLFGVVKPQSSLRRVIVDRRRRNSIERCLRNVVAERALAESWPVAELEHAWRLLTLPHGSQLSEIMCTPLGRVLGWSEDARDYFYLLRYDDIRHSETIIGYDVPTSEFEKAELEQMGVPEDWHEFALALVSPAMGDQKSMEIAQLCHQHVMLRNGGMTLRSWISYRWDFPIHPIISGCYCDDFGQLGVVAPDIEDDEFGGEAVLSTARDRIDCVHKGYATSGLIHKEAKAQKEVETLTLWGATVDGKEKVVRGTIEKLKALVQVTGDLLTHPTVSSDELSSLLGHWTHHCLFRRSTLCLLDEAYAWIRRDDSGVKRRWLGPRVRDELLGLMVLWPLISSNMQAVPSPYVYASDATVTRGAVLESEPLSVEDAVFMWSRRQQKWEGMVRAGPESRDLYDFPAAPRAEQDSLMEHKLLSLRMHVGASYRFRRQSHINVQELLAFRTALKMAVKRRQCWSRRVSFFIDSQVVVNVIARGRSSSHQLNFVLQTCLALGLFCDLVPVPVWVGTEENPADDPTRGRPLRERVPLEEIAERGIQKALERYRWTLLVTRAQWDARRRMWDGSLGFPGEGPERRAVPRENRGKDLRVRVSPLTLRRYKERVEVFQDWLTEQGFGAVSELVKDEEKINAALVPYLQGLYNQQRPLSHGSYLLAGLQLLYPMVVGKLQASWRVQKQWQVLTPAETRTPLPVEVLLALAVCGWVRGLRRTATALILGFHLMLRPAEIASAKRRHLTLPSDTGGALDSGVFAVMKSKTATRTTLLQSVVLEDEKVLSLAESVFGPDPPDCLWVRGGIVTLQKNFVQLKEALALGRTPFTLGSLRAGGAVEYFRRTSNGSGLQVRGRWVSQRSMFHYTQLSLAAVSMSCIDPDARDRVYTLARMASTLLNPLLWPSTDKLHEAGLEMNTDEGWSAFEKGYDAFPDEILRVPPLHFLEKSAA